MLRKRWLPSEITEGDPRSTFYCKRKLIVHKIRLLLLPSSPERSVRFPLFRLGTPAATPSRCRESARRHARDIHAPRRRREAEAGGGARLATPAGRSAQREQGSCCALLRSQGREKGKEATLGTLLGAMADPFLRGPMIVIICGGGGPLRVRACQQVVSVRTSKSRLAERSRAGRRCSLTALMIDSCEPSNGPPDEGRTPPRGKAKVARAGSSLTW
jgi:hypothetical protein